MQSIIFDVFKQNLVSNAFTSLIDTESLISSSFVSLFRSTESGVHPGRWHRVKRGCKEKSHDWWGAHQAARPTAAGPGQQPAHHWLGRGVTSISWSFSDFKWFMQNLHRLHSLFCFFFFLRLTWTKHKLLPTSSCGHWWHPFVSQPLFVSVASVFPQHWQPSFIFLATVWQNAWELSLLVPGENTYRVDAQHIKSKAGLLHKYLCDEQKELQALYALQALMVHMEQPASECRVGDSPWGGSVHLQENSLSALTCDLTASHSRMTSCVLSP